MQKPEAKGQKGRAKPPKATAKPYSRHILGIDSGVQSHTKATPKPHQGYTKATPRLHQGHLRGFPQLQTARNSHINAPIERHARNRYQQAAMNFLTHRRRFIKTMALASASVPIGLRDPGGGPAGELPAPHHPRPH